MDKKKENNRNNSKKVDSTLEKTKTYKDHEDYGYDFVPTLDEWLNIDEQRERTEELENM